MEYKPGLVATDSRGFQLANPIAEAKFFNPYPASEGSWSNGFLLRDPASNLIHTLFIRSDGYWYHLMRPGSGGASQQLQRVFLDGIDTRGDGSNHLRVILLRGEGWLFINGSFAGALDLSTLSGVRDIRAMAGFFTADQVAGKATRFEGLRVWSLR